MLQRILILGLVLLLTTGCGKKKIEIGRENPEKEILKCIELSEKKHYEEAVECLEIFKSRFADTPQGQEAELRIADNHFSQKDYLIAADTYQSFLKLHPLHPKADYASYRAGLSYLKEAPKAIDRDQQYLLQAVDLLESTTRYFATSPYLEPAKQELKTARDRLAKRHFYIGRFYYRTGEYLAAIPRFEEILREFPQSRVERKALYYLTLSHLELGRETAAASAFEQLKLSYPEDKLTKKAAKKLVR